nr:hypothetical protein [Clostridia bacterium]
TYKTNITMKKRIMTAAALVAMFFGLTAMPAKAQVFLDDEEMSKRRSLPPDAGCGKIRTSYCGGYHAGGRLYVAPKQ